LSIKLLNLRLLLKLLIEVIGIIDVKMYYKRLILKMKPFVSLILLQFGDLRCVVNFRH